MTAEIQQNAVWAKQQRNVRWGVFSYDSSRGGEFFFQLPRNYTKAALFYLQWPGSSGLAALSEIVPDQGIS